MRIILRLSPNTKPVPFDHLHNLTGAIHKWLGDNSLHDGLSLYSFGWLRGGKPRDKQGLDFPRGSRWWISFYDATAAKACLRTLTRDPDVAFGMQIVEAQILDDGTFGPRQQFKTDGAVVTRERREDGSRRYLLWHEPEADEGLTRTLRGKLKAAGFTGQHLQTSLRFDRSYPGAKTKLSTIKGIKHKGSLCPIIVEGTPEAVAFAYTVGVGELTGSGFGGLQTL
ncbi:MAG: CRISPR-associated endoribonuclease Cas6 [Bacteroidota bacterium]